jgi:DNA-directed RNA polymerase specialized sigma24 family protein
MEALKMKLATILEQIRGNNRYATADDIRKIFGDYHNVLHWLALFLIGDMEIADGCVVDACTIAQSQTSLFHEWLVHWAARATLRQALQIRHSQIVEIASEYGNREPLYPKRLPLTAEHFQRLIENSEEVHARLDVLCRFVLVLHGIARDSCDQVAAQLGVSQNTVEQAYCTAFETLDLVSKNEWRSCSGEMRIIRSEAKSGDSRSA